MSISLVRGRIALVTAVLAALAVFTSGPSAAQEQAAIRAAEVLATRGHQAVVSGNIGQLTSLVRQTFALSSWEDYLLGDQASKLTSAQRAEFRRLLPGYLAKLYARQFSGSFSGAPTIEGARPARGDILVQASVPRTGGRALKVDWRMRRVGGGYKVVDFIVGGVSYLVTKRAEFTGVIQRQGPDALLAFLRKF